MKLVSTSTWYGGPRAELWAKNRADETLGLQKKRTGASQIDQSTPVCRICGKLLIDIPINGLNELQLFREASLSACCGGTGTKNAHTFRGSLVTRAPLPGVKTFALCLVTHHETKGGKEWVNRAEMGKKIGKEMGEGSRCPTCIHMTCINLLHLWFGDSMEMRIGERVQQFKTVCDFCADYKCKKTV